MNENDITGGNAVLASLRFNVDNIAKQMELIEQMAKQTALKAQEAFKNTSLLTPANTQQMTAQQSMVAQITAQGEAKKAAIVAEGEAKISAIQAKESLTRQAIAQKEAQAQLAIARQQVEQEKLLYMQSRRAAFEQKPQGFAGLMERRASWLVTGGLVMGGIAGLAGTISTIKDVEMGMTTIARVTEDAAFSFKGMRDELQQLGITYGDTWEDVSDIAIRWAQAGYDMADTLELTKSSLLALNTAELNSEQATNGMIAIMAQWGLTAEELLPTIDAINKVADDFAITSTDLVAGLQRSSGAAKVLGLNMKETIAILTVMRESTGRTGREIGNALNSILSFMQRPTAIKAFETEGITVFANTARTEFRNVIEIFDEMARKWPKMSESSRDAFADQAEAAGLYSEEMAEILGIEEQYNDIQQRNLSQAAAGIYRRNYLLALLQNWSKVDEVLIAQENSLGYSLKENERTMQTLEKQIEVLKASAEQLAVALGDAGLLREITALVEGVTDVVQWFNNLDDTTQTVLLTLIEVTTAVKLLTIAFKGLGISGALAGAGGLMAGWAVPISATTAATRGLLSALTGVSALLTNVGRGIIAAFGGPVVAAIIGVSTAAIAVARNMASANEELIAHGEIAENMVVEYDRLSEKLDGISKGTDEYNQTAKELNIVKGQIADSLPEVIDGWDKESDSVKINREEMEKLIVASKDLKKSQEDLTESLKSSIQLMQTEVAEHAKQAQEWESEKNVLQDLVERRDKLTEALARQIEGSGEAKKTEEALGETERLIADIAEEAGLKRNATVDEIIDKLNKLKVAENQAAINTQTAELNKTKAVKKAAIARLEIIQQEINAYNDPMSWGFMQAAGNFLKQINPLNQFNKDPRHLNIDNLKKERAESVKAAKQAKSQIESIERAIKDSQRNIAAINADIATGGDYSAPGAPGGSGSKGKEIDEIAEALKRLAETSKMFEIVNMGIESAMDAVGRKLNVANAEYDYLNSKIENGTATTEDYARMQELLARKIALLNNEQVQLTNANRQYQQQIDALTPLLAKATDEYERFKTAGDEEHMKNAASAVSSLKSEMDSLSGAIASNTQKIWENKGAMEQLATSAYTAYYQQTMAWMQHMEAIGRMNAQLEAEILASIDKERLEREQLWDLEEKQYRNRLEMLQRERDRIKDAYDARMRQYESEIETNDRLIEQKEEQANAAVSAIDEQIKAIQKLMDLLDDDAEAEDREEAARQHEQKLAELAEERMYHQLRTGLEHQDAIADIDKQIAEEDRRWSLQQNQWAREDQKDAYQDQIDALREEQKAIEKAAREEINQIKKQNDRKKQEMQKFYSELERLLDDSNLRMMAATDVSGEELERKMAEIARIASEAFRGNLDFGSALEQIDDLIGGGGSGGSPGGGTGGGGRPPEPGTGTGGGGKRLKAVVGPENYVNKSGYTYAWSQTLAGLLGYSATWNQADGTVTINGRKFTPAWNDNGRTYLGIREVAEALGYSVTYNDKNREVSIWDKAHDGAKVLRDGAAVLRHDERVLSPKLTASFDRLASILVKTPDISSMISGGGTADLNRVADKIITAMERRRLLVDKAVNIENVSLNDRADMQALGIEIRSMLTANG